MTFHTQPLWPARKGPDAALCGDADRLTVLASYGLDDLAGDAELQRIAAFAASLCGAPMAMVSLVEAERQLFLARIGLEEGETPRAVSFCAHTMMQGDLMIVPDARQDVRFADNALVTGAPHIRFYAGAPLISVEGAPLGALCVVDTQPRDGELTDLQREGLEVLARAVMQRLMIERQDRAALAVTRKRERELQNMLDSVPGIAWSCDGDGNFDMFNARWQEATGREPPRTADQWQPFVHPDDYEAARTIWDKAVGGASLFTDEWRLLLADGNFRWVLARAVPALDEDGASRWFGTLIDIDDAHRLSELRELLAHELAHRIKNIFAVVSGLIIMRARGRDDVQPFADEIGATIRALGTAHDYVQPHSGRTSDDLVGLLHDLLAPYQDGEGARVRIGGDTVPLGVRAATPLALIFHELATNSAKYGALGSPDGHVAIAVDANEVNDVPICIEWREYVPGFTVPEDGPSGFGSRLLKMSVEGQLGGAMERTYESDGLHVVLRVPRSALGA